MKKQHLLILTVFLLLGLNSSGQEKESISEALIEKAYTKINKTIRHYKKLKKNLPERYNFEDENELNNLGYLLLADNRVSDAIEIFKLLVSEFPDSYNAYDSLGEAYFKGGELELAILNYQKSLQLNPNNSNADRVINQIRYETRDTAKFSKIYSKQNYLDDLDELGKTLTETNPHPYRFMSKDDFWSVVESKKSKITDSTTYAEFIWHCSEIIANINCGHSGVNYYFSQEGEMLPDSLRFPMEVRLIDNRLYVGNPLVNEDKIVAGAEIFSINGKSVPELQAMAYPHIPSQGTSISPKQQIFTNYSTAVIAYALGFPEHYEVVIKNKEEPISLTQLSTYIQTPKRLSTCDEPLCFRILKDEKVAILTIKTWEYYGRRIEIFKNFIDESFAKINTAPINSIIIDVRGNGGGASDAGIYLLKHLVQSPFNYYSSSAFNEKLGLIPPHENRFGGDSYFLVDGRGGSVTGHVLSIVKHLGLSTIVGEELGSNTFATGGQKTFRLSNTSVFYSVGRFTYISQADSVSDERGVFPDHHIVQGIDDYLKGIDTELEYTLNLIREK